MVDSLSRKPYKPGENGNMIPLLPKRHHSWDDDCPIEIARTRSDDDTWIPYMTKRFGQTTPRSNDNDDSGNESDCLEVAALYEEIPQWNPNLTTAKIKNLSAYTANLYSLTTYLLRLKSCRLQLVAVHGNLLYNLQPTNGI